MSPDDRAALIAHLEAMLERLTGDPVDGTGGEPMEPDDHHDDER